MKQIDTGGLSFRELREKDKYYVDKSLLIRDILSRNDSGVYLFTRPRRFGKTTNLSMLDAFFNMEYKGNTWFDDLEISEYPEYEKYRNAFPVIHLNLKDAKSSDFEGFLHGMKESILTVLKEHPDLPNSLELTEDEKLLFKALFAGTVGRDDLKVSVKKISDAMKRHYGKKVVILVDEYDRAVSDAFGSEFHRPMMDFLGDFLSAALKNNENLQMAYVTGIMQIAGESIFSGLNNINVNNIFSDRSDERFGFTEAEVKQILSDYGHPEKFAEVKQWYDGYRFGSAEVYNPFSVMNYVFENFKAESYWANSGGNWIIKDLLDRINDDNFENIAGLIYSEGTETELRGTLAFDDLDSDDETLYSLMAMAGYLKAVPAGNKVYEVSIPNEEVRGEVENLMKKRLPINTSDFTKFSKAILGGDTGVMEKILGKVLLCGSYMNLKDENAYEMVVMTLLYPLVNRYSVRTEREEGNGRTDILLTSGISGNPNMILEMKVAESEEKIDSSLEEAMCQIHEKKYCLGMSGKVILMAMAFWKKVPKIRIETVEI